jgi:putative hydrolase of the HAD superfamily
MSCAVGLRKPDPEMFAHVEAQLGVKPDECVLVDDFAANVAGARAAGWHGLLVTDVDASIAELEALLAQHGRETPATR